MNKFKLDRVENALKIKFNNPTLIKTALTHSSYAKQFKGADYNERLEFLGDSVLQLTITEYLFINCKNKAEGELTKIRSVIVCENSLYEVAQNLKLASFMLMSKGEEITGGRERVSIQADSVEAVIASIYLDNGLDKAKEFILHNFKEIIKKAINNKIVLDFKTKLQEYLQKDGEVEIDYQLARFEGPPHRRKFFIEVYVEEVFMGEGHGFSKKEAEQNCAKEALEKLGVLNE